jgi:hypothetical protein
MCGALVGEIDRRLGSICDANTHPWWRHTSGMRQFHLAQTQKRRIATSVGMMTDQYGFYGEGRHCEPVSMRSQGILHRPAPST